MPRIRPVTPSEAGADVQALYEAARSVFGGKLPNLVQTFAQSPATLGGFLSLSGQLGKGRLTSKQREIVALAVAQFNDCHYCLAAHVAAAKGAGLSADQVHAAREGRAGNSLENALAALAKQIAETRGHLRDMDLAIARGAGLDDGLIVETVANVVANIFTNYTNNVAQTELDFPKVESALES